MFWEKPLYQELASLVDAYHRCIDTKNDYAPKHLDRIKELCEDYLPHGSGFDNDGCHLDIDNSTSERLVIAADYHCMNDNGMYDGWIDYRVIIKPSLQFGYTMRIVGKEYHGTKDYMYDILGSCLSEQIKIGADPDPDVIKQELIKTCAAMGYTAVLTRQDRQAANAPH